jgi:hypothetical protein
VKSQDFDVAAAISGDCGGDDGDDVPSDSASATMKI